MSLRLLGKRAFSTTPRAAAGTLADQQADALPKWKGTSADGSATKLLIGGEWIESQSSKHIDVCDPSTQRVLTKVPETTSAELRKATDTAHNAWLNGWRDSSIISRQQIMLKLQDLLKKNHDHLAQSITSVVWRCQVSLTDL